MSYDVNDIKTLEYPESVQRRAGMYLGEQSKKLGAPGQQNTGVREIIDNSVTEVIKGFGSVVKCTFKKDGTVIIEDDGRGIPVDVDKETGQTGIEKCVASLHSGASFGNDVPGRYGASLNGVGGACVNALCERFDVEVFRRGWLYTEKFVNGYVTEELSKRKAKEEDIGIDFDTVKGHSGTRIVFRFNPDFFSDIETIVTQDIIDRLRYISYVVPEDLTVHIIDETRDAEEGGGEYTFTNDGGIEGMLDFIAVGDPVFKTEGSEYSKNGIHKISTEARYREKVTKVVDGKTVVSEETSKIPIEVAFRYNDTDKSDVRSFANTVHTINGGVHQSALERALMDTFGKMASK